VKDVVAAVQRGDVCGETIHFAKLLDGSLKCGAFRREAARIDCAPS
jgi:hypothetical protein